MYNKISLKNVFKNLIVLIMGTLSVYIVMESLENMLKSKGNNFEKYIFLVLLVIISLFLGFIISIFIHELGQLLFGKLTKYKFVGFRIFDIMIVKIDDQLKIKKYNLPGTLGQCFMVRDLTSDGKIPYLIYLLGGSLLNFIFGIFMLFVALLTSELLIILRIAFFIIALVGICFCLNNIIPRNVKGILNDGYNIIRLNKSREAQRIFALELRIQELLISGKRYKDMPAEWFILADSNELDDETKFSVGILLFNYLFDKQEFEKAKALAAKILSIENVKLDIQKQDLLCELLFIEIISHSEQDRIEELYSEDIKKHITIFRHHLAKQRFLYSYAKLVSHDKKESERIHKVFKQTCLTYPMIGEIESEKELIFLIDNISR